MAKNRGGGGASAKPAASIAAAGPVLSKNEATKIADARGQTVAQVMAAAQNKGTALGAGLVNAFNNQKLGPNVSSPLASMGIGVNKGTAEALQQLQALKNLQMQPGTAYAGYSTTTTPAYSNNNPFSGSTYVPGSTTYNPIVVPRNMGGGAGNNANGTGNNNTSGNGNDPYQDLRDQIAAAQQTINDLQNQPVDPYADLEQLLAGQQAQALAQQEAMAAQAAQQQQALQGLMIQQQQAYDTQMAEARRQQEVMAAQAAESQRQAMAVANARVPGLEPTATAPSLGDARFPGRSAAANTLSNLAILTGLGTSAGVTTSAATPLSGLQIA